jgi:hypothetical protein
VHSLSSFQPQEARRMLGGESNESARAVDSAQDKNRSSSDVDVREPQHRQLPLLLLLHELPLHVNRVYGWRLLDLVYLSVHEKDA